MPRHNYLTNPSLETDVDSWSTSGVAIQRSNSVTPVAGAQYGYSSLTATGTLTIAHEYVSVIPGASYTVSVSANRTGTGNIQLVIWWYESVGVSINYTPVGQATPATNTWTRLSSSGTAPTNAALARLGLYFYSMGANAAARFDAAMLEDGATVGTYADGDTAGWEWQGTPHASTSVEIVDTEGGAFDPGQIRVYRAQRRASAAMALW